MHRIDQPDKSSSDPSQRIMLTTRLLLFCLPLITPASCWGGLGHRTVAYLAQYHLTPSARDWLGNITKGADISDEAEWPDKCENKDETGKWHVIDVRDKPDQGQCSVHVDDECYYYHCRNDHEHDYKTKCTKECIVTYLRDQVQNVQKPLNKSDPHDSDHRRYAIRYILHLMGDLHQPLHAEGYYGGGHELCVKFGEHGGSSKFCKNSPSLHEVWDDYILWKIRKFHEVDDEHTRQEAIKWAAELKNNVTLQSCDGGVQNTTNVCECVKKWTNETNKVNCDVVYTKSCDVKCLTSTDLSDAYFNRTRMTAVEQIIKAGGRLAALINDMAAAASHSTLTLNVQEL